MSEDRFKKWRQSEKGKLSLKIVSTETKKRWKENNKEKLNKKSRNNKIVNFLKQIK